MLIPLTSPIDTPAVPANTYPLGWVSLFVVSAPTTSAGSVRLELSAMDQNGEVKPGGYVEVLTTDDMLEAVADPDFPEAKAVYDAVVAVVEPFRAWLAAREAASNPPI